jgi:hypothetical protein
MRAIWAIAPQVNAVRYRSRLDSDRFCYGLFDRVESDLLERNLGNLVDFHPRKLAQILTDYDYVLL